MLILVHEASETIEIQKKYFKGWRASILMEWKEVAREGNTVKT